MICSYGKAVGGCQESHRVERVPVGRQGATLLDNKDYDGKCIAVVKRFKLLGVPESLSTTCIAKADVHGLTSLRIG